MSACTCGHAPGQHYDECLVASCKCSNYSDAEAATLRARVTALEVELQKTIAEDSRELQQLRARVTSLECWGLEQAAELSAMTEDRNNLMRRGEDEANKLRLETWKLRDRVAELELALREIANCKNDSRIEETPWMAEQALAKGTK